MIDERILNLVMGIELALLVFSVALFFTHGFWLYLRTQRRERLLAEGRIHLVNVLAGNTDATSEIDFLRSLPRNVKTRVFLEISRSLTGDAKARLKSAARQSGLVDAARFYCRSNDWRYRLRGARLMTNLEEADAIVSDLLHDRNASVRAQAAEWASIRPTPQVIRAILSHLADPDTHSRFALQDSLLRMGSAVVLPLVEYLDRHSGVAADTGLQVAAALRVPAFLSPALHHVRSSNPETRRNAAAVLASIGGQDASRELEALLNDSVSNVRAAAAAGLGELSYWPAATKLASLLDDDTWQVRREAALALRRIGGPGILLLRKATTVQNARSADIAQMILDTPLQMA